MTQFYFINKMTGLILLLLCLSSGKLQAQLYANSQTNGSTGLCVLCGVSNPENPVNNASLDDYSTFNITAGLLGVTLYQTLIFPAQSTPGCDSLIIGIGSGAALLSVNLLGGVTVQTFNGATANNDLQTISVAALRLLQTNNRGEITLKPSQTFDRVKVTLNSTLVGLLNSLQLYYAYRKPAVPTPVGTDSVAICAGNTTTVSVTTAPGTTVSWYNAAAGGTLLATGNSYNVSPLVTTTYYAEATQGGCKSLRKAVKVIIRPKPANPVYTVPQGAGCGPVSIVVTNYKVGINYRVRVKYGQTFSTLLDTAYTVTNSATIPLPDFINNITYQADTYIQAVDALTGCKSDTVHQAFIRGGSAELPTVDADSVTICKGKSATLHAYTPTSAFWPIRWYDAPVGGRLLYTGNYYTVSPNQTTIYYVTAISACEYPRRKAVKVVVTRLPDPVYTVPQGFVCGNRGSLSLPVTNHRAGLIYKVRNVYTANTAVLLDTSYTVTSNTIVTPVFLYTIPVQSDIYVQAADVLTGCISDSVHQQFVLDAWGAYPDVSADSVTICSGNSVTLHANVPAAPLLNIRWYNAPVGGTLLYTGKDYTVTPAVTTTYYVTSAFSCEYPFRRPVKVIVNPCPLSTASPVKAADQLTLYPNPSVGTIWFAGDKQELTGSRFIISNLYGREVQRGVLNQHRLVLAADLPAGIYFIRIMTDKQERYHGKIVLQR
ncbi:Ig-like domain-containing protein [Chitinophaga nivalis]|uniref:T9SS type A sorting domain-containing protein n=1 Tax=Chitinophaga nivalis TaxID=2991709 RepID=A0ABT3INB8_9BACT|nr:T9SS type A sorting domain-containing protein [Chitinophaga nivalis]MCW3464830.1 T9SS type A sorting domain-containing protein [Chitinophaga nivalis]MCW3485479.1 T9SS type A sorting domain-containing protein [Chitinophaga nivalis]